LVNRPELLLADEPTGNLDPGNSREIMGLLERINLSGTTIVMATHDRSIVDQMQKRVVEVSEGQVVRDAQTAGYREVPSGAIDEVDKR
jgi:cell division transport system ATP-binding protein